MYRQSPGGRLPLLSARPAVTFPATEHQRPLAGTKLYCLVTVAHRCEQLAQGCYAALLRVGFEPTTCWSKSNDLPVAPPRHLVTAVFICISRADHGLEDEQPLKHNDFADNFGWWRPNQSACSLMSVGRDKQVCLQITMKWHFLKLKVTDCYERDQNNTTLNFTILNYIIINVAWDGQTTLRFVKHSRWQHWRQGCCSRQQACWHTQETDRQTQTDRLIAILCTLPG